MVALTTYRCWQKQYIICWNVPIARSFSECQTKKKQRSHHIHQVETCRVSSEVPSHCFTGGVRVKLVIILSLLEEYSSILEKKNYGIIHSCTPVELSCISKLKRFKFPDARIESQVLSFEVREARFLCEIIFVQSHSRSEICTISACGAVFCIKLFELPASASFQ